ncbi:hypothetical protein D9M71_818710 [compost metagenome]
MRSAACSEELLPEPVGPVIRISPAGRENRRSSAATSSGKKPISSRPARSLCSGSKRMTVRSPESVISVDTRTVMGESSTVARKLPSCGRRCSEISISAASLM